MITAQVENLTETLEELKPLLPLHWEELALNKDDVPLDPQYDVYLQKDACGEVSFVTVRDSGDLVGYMVTFISPGLHYQTCLTAITDIFYLVQDKRGKEGGHLLFDAAEKEFKRRGVQRWFAGSKNHKGCEYFLVKHGLEPVETMHSKMIGD